MCIMGQSFGGVDFTGFGVGIYWAILCIVLGSEIGGFGVEIKLVFFLGFDLSIFRTFETLAVDSSGLRQF